MQVAMAGDGDAMAMPTGEHLLTLICGAMPHNSSDRFICGSYTVTQPMRMDVLPLQ